jgi:AmmeMemoRadiSam system protein B
VVEAVRRSPIAGTWYPADAGGVERMLDQALGGVEPRALPGRLVALISPHAGLVYSGPVAAHGYAWLRGRRDLAVVIVGPSHFQRFEGAAVFASGSWETPLGRVPVDEDIARALIDADASIVADTVPHAREHSIEMQLPFLQRLVPGLRIVPMLMGSQRRAEVELVSRALSRVLASLPALLVASSDLSHYHPAPEAWALDALVLGDVERFDASTLMDRLESSDQHACGGGPMVAVMRAAQALGADRSQVLCYADSGDVEARDKSRVVGYLSAALFQGA